MLLNFFLLFLFQATGWPKDSMTEDEKERYIKHILECDNVAIDPNKVEKNPGRRKIAKQMLNTLWGKFGQRTNIGKVEYFTDPEPFLKLVMDDKIVIRDIHIVSPLMVRVRYSHDDVYVEPLPNINICVAAYTTAMARLQLYSYMEHLGERLIYFDTDSIFFESPIDINCETLKTGSAMGELTDELDNNDYITEFVSSGAKSYAYTTKNSKDPVVKMKGVTLNYNTCKKINFKSVVDLVLNKETAFSIPITTTRKFIRNSRLAELKSAPYTKCVKFVYDKRVIIDNNLTVPYGYQK